MTTSSNADASAALGVPLVANVPVTVDTKGRVRATREQRRLILAEFERRGLSAARFAKLTGLKYSTFSAWLRRYHRPKPPARKQPIRLLEAVVEPSHSSATMPLVVHLPGGARLEICDGKQAVLGAALVRALEKPC